MKRRQDGTYPTVCSGTAERLSSTVVYRSVGTDEGGRVVFVNKSDT